MRESAFSDWGFSGPIAVKEYLGSIHESGTDIGNYHLQWVKNSNVNQHSAVCHEHRNLVESLRLGITKDQIDPSNLMMCELMVRRLVQLEVSLTRNPNNPYTVVWRSSWRTLCPRAVLLTLEDWMSGSHLVWKNVLRLPSKLVCFVKRLHWLAVAKEHHRVMQQQRMETYGGKRRGGRRPKLALAQEVLARRKADFPSYPDHLCHPDDQGNFPGWPPMGTVQSSWRSLSCQSELEWILPGVGGDRFPAARWLDGEIFEQPCYAWIEFKHWQHAAWRGT